jgi:hypothetical protein
MGEFSWAIRSRDTGAMAVPNHPPAECQCCCCQPIYDQLDAQRIGNRAGKVADGKRARIIEHRLDGKHPPEEGRGRLLLAPLISSPRLESGRRDEKRTHISEHLVPRARQFLPGPPAIQAPGRCSSLHAFWNREHGLSDRQFAL